jgi:hypothetical protein
VGAGCSTFEAAPVPSNDGGETSDAAASDAASSDGGVPRDGATMPSSDAGVDACATAVFATDPKNCGTCGHDCMGGTCSGGVCQPFLVGNADASASSIAANANGIYWVTKGGTQVVSCPSGGCVGSPSVLAASLTGTVALTAVGADLAVLDYNDLQHVTTPAGASVIIYPTGNPGISNSSVLCGDDTAFVYFQTQINGNQTAMRILVDGGSVLPGDYVFNNNLATVGCGAGHFSYMLYGSPDTIYACAEPADCGTTSSIIPGQGSGTVQLATTATDIFFIRANPGTLNSCPIKTGCASPTVLKTATGIDGVAVDDTYVYFTNSTEGSVSRCTQDGCAASLTVLAKNQINPHALVVTKDAVYWATDAIPPSGMDAGSPAAIYRVAK